MKKSLLYILLLVSLKASPLPFSEITQNDPKHSLFDVFGTSIYNFQFEHWNMYTAKKHGGHFWGGGSFYHKAFGKINSYARRKKLVFDDPENPKLSFKTYFSKDFPQKELKQFFHSIIHEKRQVYMNFILENKNKNRYIILPIIRKYSKPENRLVLAFDIRKNQNGKYPKWIIHPLKQWPKFSPEEKELIDQHLKKIISIGKIKQ